VGDTPAAATPEAAVVDAEKVVQAVVAVDAVKAAVPADRAEVQVDRAAASANISAKRKFASSASRRWT
jgi:hypothetical protein